MPLEGDASNGALRDNTSGRLGFFTADLAGSGRAQRGIGLALIWAGMAATSKKAVLIADGEPSFRSSLLEGLANYRDELQAIVALHGAAALEALRARKIDLPFADLRMPVMDRFGLLQAPSTLGERIPAIIAELGANPLFPSAKRGGKNHE